MFYRAHECGQGLRISAHGHIGPAKLDQWFDKAGFDIQGLEKTFFCPEILFFHVICSAKIVVGIVGGGIKKVFSNFFEGGDGRIIIALVNVSSPQVVDGRCKIGF